ncbi:uncharacterized protein LOC107772502 isoform X1 [Nicotiana tabacum]|uniref:Uncharacterized protein isoform X1 n=1 Tax=Nicotiana tabacum TaxID=4097 RepID=A0A1S3Y6F2_TOBAC|nr:PREDICTED: uncharacterized protein LOC107772502 isoform X1 [Nicotiana tabacum]XP_016447487.1 PREDICTED: uncharacterized protein LOC107772502 isoform X1 [Nicotiana tabacum]
MAMRSVVSSSGVRRLMDGSGRSSVSGLRYFTDGKGRVLSEEERAKETVYIQKMERERMEKAKLKAEREKADKENMSRIDPANPGSSVGVETL